MRNKDEGCRRQKCLLFALANKRKKSYLKSFFSIAFQRTFKKLIIKVKINVYKDENKIKVVIFTVNQFLKKYLYYTKMWESL